MERIRKLAGAARNLNRPRSPFPQTHSKSSKGQKSPRNIKYINPLRYEKPPDPNDDKRLSELAEGVVVEEGHGPEAVTKYAPNFTLPIRVLDLDAEDSQYVRPFDEETDGLEQRLKWAVDPLLEELRSQAELHHHDFKKEAAAMSRAAKEPFGPQAISDHDIFTIALLEAPDSPVVSQGATHSPIRPLHARLRNQGVPQSTLNQGPSETIPFMLHRQRLAAQKLDEETRSLHRGNAPKLTSFAEEVNRSRNLSEVRLLSQRISSPISAKHVGGQPVARLYQRCQSLYPLEDLEKTCDQPSTAEDGLAFLKFVNNSTIYCLLNGRRLQAGMTLFGLQLASRHGIMPSILQYLQIYLSLKNIQNAMRNHPAVSLQVTRNILVALEQTNNFAIGTRQELLKLLFGLVPNPSDQYPSLLGSPAEYRKQDPERHQLRLQLMGQLGALRLLWRAGSESDDAALVDAFHRFAQLVSGVEGLDLTTTGDSTEADTALDVRNMNIIEAHRAQYTLHTSSSDTPESKTSERQPSEEIIAAFREQHIGDAMIRFRGLIRGAAEG